MVRMSEYGRAFTACDVAGRYAENRDYCCSRRRREHVHTPICWDSDSSDSDNEASVMQVNGHSEAPTPGGVGGAVVPGSQTPDAVNADETEIKTLNDDREIERCDVHVGDEKSPSTGGCAARNLKKTHVVSRQVKSPMQRPTSSNMSSRVKGRNTLPHKGRQSADPPFVTYGCRDERKDMGMKQTHNVRASANVHSSALKAMKHLAIEEKLRQERKAKRRSPKPVKAGTVIVDSDWLSEYQSRYPAYDTQFYVQHLANRRHKLLY